MRASGTLSKVRRLIERADAAALRWRRPIRLDDLTDAAEERLDRRLEQLKAMSFKCSTDPDPREYCNYTDDQIMRKMLALGMVTVEDFKPDVIAANGWKVAAKR
jgi:hypothetical protein